MPWSFLPSISRNSSNSQDCCNSAIRVFLAQRKTLGRCFLQINILSSYLIIPSTILDVRVDQISLYSYRECIPLKARGLNTISDKRVASQLIMNTIEKTKQGPPGCTNADNCISLILGPATTSLIFSLRLHKSFTFLCDLI